MITIFQQLLFQSQSSDNQKKLCKTAKDYCNCLIIAVTQLLPITFIRSNDLINGNCVVIAHKVIENNKL